MNGIPKNWLGCPPHANGLVGNIFYTFKTPLSPALNRKLGHGDQLSPQNIFDLAKNQLGKKIAVWIDLTNTSRYYDKSVVEAASIKYIKFALEGHGSFPTKSQRAHFESIVDEFLSLKKDGECIAVHCTHGFNRTGFLICCYLVFKMGYRIEDAMNEFCTKRSPGIYRQNYVEELFRICAGGRAPLPPKVTTPEWARGGRDGYNYNNVNNHHGETPQHGRLNNHHNHQVDNTRKRPSRWSNASPTGYNTRYNEDRHNYTMDYDKRIRFDVDVTFSDLAAAPPQYDPLSSNFFDKEIRNIRNYAFGDGNKKALLTLLRHLCRAEGDLFPMPKKLTEEYVPSLGVSERLMSWQAVGKRFYLFIQSEEQIYLVDDEESVWTVNGMHFPHKRDNIHLTNTVLYGEMTRIIVDSKSQPAFVISEIVSLNGSYVGRLTLTTRRKCLKEEILSPRAYSISKKLFHPSLEPFGIRSKPYFTLEEGLKLLQPGFEFRLAEEPEGIIFHSSKDAFKVGPLQNAFKWDFKTSSNDNNEDITKEQLLEIMTRLISSRINE